MSLSKKILPWTLLILVAGYVAWELKGPPEPQVWNTSGSPSTELKVLERAFYYVKNNYIEPDRLKPEQLLKNGLTALQKGLPPVMVSWRDDDFVIAVHGERRRFELPKPLELIHFPLLLGHLADFLNGKIDDVDIEATAEENNLEYLLLSGMISALDPHSSFLAPRIYSEFKIGTKGNFGGIGIAIGLRNGNLTVISPLEGTPADEAGIKAQDRIVQINNERTINMSLTEAVERLRGKVGTLVTVWVERDGVSEPLSFKIRRDLIKIDSVKAQVLEKKIALVKIKNFQEDTTREFYRQLRELSAKTHGLEGIILDLRNNPGGLLDQAVSIADACLEQGTIVKTVGFNEQLNENDEAGGNDPYEKIPIVVLVNEGSASASEIVAGALQAHHRALVIGNQTFGKGTVQTIYDLKDGSAIKITIAKYLAAGTEDVQIAGIIPDIGLIPMRLSEERFDIVADEARRESDYEDHFIEPVDNGPIPDPLFQLQYVAREETEEEPISGTVQLTEDYPVRLAHQILSERPYPSRIEMLTGIDRLLAEAKQEQQRSLITALAEKNIDWHVGPQAGEPKAEIRFWLTAGEQTITELIGGQEATAHLEVHNVGTGDYFSLIGITRSDNPFFSELEFPLGHIAPGEKQTFKQLIKIPGNVVARQEPVTLRFEEAYNRAPPPRAMPILLLSPETPRFSYRWSFKDPSLTKLPVGKDIELLVEVKNLGPGLSEQPVVNLANLEGDRVFLSKGRVKLEPIQAGATGEAILRFRLQEGYDTETARLELSIEDHHTADFLRDKLTFDLEGMKHDPPVGRLQEPPALALTLPNPPYWSKEDHYHLKAVAHDDQGVKHVYLYVGTEKVFYQTAGDTPVTDLPVSIAVPLQDGENRITLVIEDGEELLTRKDWIVWKPKPD